ncbi:putative D-isomer specific 2-hydroxyacid dehydrogenase [Yersinia intermedia]|uniref:Glyoxylate/hydroxypyruvate reductase B n=2 Tax=Yersinia intermedia TaxID=631 RepID=A0A0H5LXG8_YERIN|nr:putative D-isomer specific 2-hydroxyacid dehydrogenase [Yersinia intermedia]
MLDHTDVFAVMLALDITSPNELEFAMKPSIVLYKSIPDDLHQRLAQHFTVNSFEGLTPDNQPELLSALAQAQGLIGSGGKIDSAFLQLAPRLRVASTISVGYDNFDVEALNQRGVALMHTPTVLTETVADTMMALMLSTARRVVELAERVKAGKWRESITDDWYGVDVHHKTIGILGMGRIGMALAQRAHFGFSMPVLYTSRRPHEEAETRFGARRCDLDTLLAEVDFLCITLPMTEQTYHMIGREQLAKMKSSAILINAGRGPVVDEQALIAALQDGTLHGAGLDVFEQEPLPVDSPLLALRNVVAVPHIGSATHETRYNMAACAVDNLIAALTGTVKENCVNPQVLQQA